MTTLSLSARAQHLQPSPTLAMSSRARELAGQGKEVVSFGAGEPDFDTPGVIVQAAVEALQSGSTRYTATPGIPALRAAIADKLKRENSVDVTADQIVVSCGAKQSLFNALMTVIGPGDEVIVFAPYWMTYLEQIYLAGGTPVIVDTTAADGFEPNLEKVKAAFTPRTRAVIVNSPSNPTGAVYGRAFIEWLAEETGRHSCWIVTDEIYERLVYGVEHVSVASLGRDVAERTILINGCSKSFAMTGWRIGYAAAPVTVAKAMSNLQDQVTSNATSFAQSGAVAALNEASSSVEDMRKEFEARRNLIVDGLNSIAGISCDTPKGAFYVFPKVPMVDDVALADHLLDKYFVATVPGSVFGTPGHLRLSYATSPSEIEKGLGRIREAFQRMQS